MAFTAKLSTIFLLPGGGTFSETYYASVASLDDARTKLDNYAQGRRDFMPNGCIIKGYRISNVASGTRLSDSGEWDYDRPGSVLKKNNRDFGNGGALIKLRAGDRHSVRVYRGLPDDYFQWLADGSFVETSELIAFKDWLQAKLIALSFALRVQSTDDAVLKPTKISAVTLSEGTMVSVTSSGADYVVGEQAQITGCKGLGAGKINGVYTVLGEVFSPTPEVVSLTRKTIGQTLYQLGSGTIRHRAWVYPVIDFCAIERAATRKVGAVSPFVGRGRRSTRR